MEVVIYYSGLRACSPPWLVTLASNVALPTTTVTSPCKNDRRVERVSWSVFNWKYIDDCTYLRRSTGLRFLGLLLGLSARSLSLCSGLLLGSLGRLCGEGLLGLRPRLLSLAGGGDGGGGGGGGGGDGAAAGGGAGAGGAGSGAGSSAGAGASAGGLPGSSSKGGGLSANNKCKWSSSSISTSLSMAMSGK